MSPLLFLDFDDVLCLNNPYGGYDVAVRPWPSDLLERLWHRPALNTLQAVLTVCRPQVVVTSSWLRIMMLPSIGGLFRMTGAPWLADALHPDGEAVQMQGQTRLDAIDTWLLAHHRGEPYAVVDDGLSGTGLAGSLHDRQGRLVLCEVGVGLLPDHAERLMAALTTPLAS